MSLKKLKHLLIRTYYRLIDPIRRVYWFIFRPKTRGAKAVIFHEGRVLLARISYGHKTWTLPGGGVNRNESFENGALREAKEEVGISASNPIFFYEYSNDQEYKRDTVQCFVMYVGSPLFSIDEQEILEAGWFLPDALPVDTRSRVKEILLKYSEWKQSHV